MNTVIYPTARIYRKFTFATPYFFKNLSVKGERENNFAALVDKPAPRCPLKVESFSDEIGKKLFFGVEEIEELAKSKN